MRERAAEMGNTAPAPPWGSQGASTRLAWCKNGCGWGQVDENGLCLRRCLRSRRVRRQLKRKEADSATASRRFSGVPEEVGR